MTDKPAKGTKTLPATSMNVQNAILGLRGRDLVSTLRRVGRHGLTNPLHTARHLLALGGQAGRVMLGDSPYQPNPATPASATRPGARTRFTAVACRPTWPGRSRPANGSTKATWTTMTGPARTFCLA